MKAVALLCIALALTAVAAAPHRLIRKLAVKADVDTDSEAGAVADIVAEAEAAAETEVEAVHPAVAAARECRDSMPTDQSWETGRQFVERTACKRCAALSVAQKCGGMWSPIQIACDAMAKGAEDWDLAFAWGGLKELKLEALKPCPPGSGPVADKMEVPVPKGWAEWLKPAPKKAAPKPKV